MIVVMRLFTDFFMMILTGILKICLLIIKGIAKIISHLFAWINSVERESDYERKR